MFLLCFGSWCYWTFFLFLVLDVIEPVTVGSDVIEPMIVGSDVIEPMITGGFRRYHHAWCYWHYFRCNSGDLASTSSQIGGSWNLPMFPLRDGSFTLMNIASLMFLAILLSSLPTILKLSRDTSWAVVFWWSMMGDGALMCSLNLSPKVLPDSPMHSSQSTLPHLYLYITPPFLSKVSVNEYQWEKILVLLERRLDLLVIY